MAWSVFNARQPGLVHRVGLARLARLPRQARQAEQKKLLNCQTLVDDGDSQRGPPALPIGLQLVPERLGQVQRDGWHGRGSA